MTSETNYGRLVLTLHVNDDSSSEAIRIDIPDNPPVYVELASCLKACRCGSALRRARIRVIADRALRVNRVPQQDVPGQEQS
jgi:hypothetical protein